jgi:hypothetical protein
MYMRFTCNSIAIRLPHAINDTPLQKQPRHAALLINVLYLLALVTPNDKRI